MWCVLCARARTLQESHSGGALVRVCALFWEGSRSALADTSARTRRAPRRECVTLALLYSPRRQTWRALGAQESARAALLHIIRTGSCLRCATAPPLPPPLPLYRVAFPCVPCLSCACICPLPSLTVRLRGLHDRTFCACAYHNACPRFKSHPYPATSGAELFTVLSCRNKSSAVYLRTTS